MTTSKSAKEPEVGFQPEFIPDEAAETLPAVPVPQPLPPVKGLPHAIGNQAMGGLVRQTSGLAVQRQAETGAPAAPTPEVTRPALLVDDTVTELAPGQMQRSAFLAQLKTAVCQTAEEALAGTMWSTIGCPYIERWFAYYSGQPSEHIERAIRRFAPETTGAATAQELIPTLTARVRQGIDQWAATGRMPRNESSGAGAAAGAAAPGGWRARLAALQQRMGGLLGGLAFKRAGGTVSENGANADPAAVQAQLTAGRSLDGRLGNRMGSAFGADFSQVRVHTDEQAARLTGDLNARAFTVGHDVAFAPGEYQPGTPIGDALIAHELAHVVQQGGQATAVAPQGTTASEPILEQDADQAAVQAVVNLYGKRVTGKQGRSAGALARLRSGLRLSRCAKDQSPTPEGVHYDRGISSCSSGPVVEDFPAHTADESVSRDELLEHLQTVDAGGVYVFFGHGTQSRSTRRFVGISPASGGYVSGEEMQEALAADDDAPTLVVLAACGSAALLENANDGGVPIAVGFSDSISNVLAATALTIFMRELNAGKTFTEARSAANDAVSNANPILGGFMNGVEIRYRAGYSGRLTLQEARDQHRSP